MLFLTTPHTRAIPISHTILIPISTGRETIIKQRLTEVYSYGSIEEGGSMEAEGGMFSNLETHHWGIGIAGVATILVTLVYFLVFRKNAKFNHLVPRGRKKVSYDALSDDDDESEYTYDEETPSLPAKDFP